MGAFKRLLGQGLIWAAGFGGFFAVLGQGKVADDFSPVVISAELDSRVDAYVPIVIRYQGMSRESYPSSRKCRELADEIIIKFASKKLLPIVPCYHGESLLEGAKGEVVRSMHGLSNYLAIIAREEYQSGLYNLAYDDAVRSAKILNTVRFGSRETYISSTTFTVRPLRLFSDLASKLDKRSVMIGKELIDVGPDFPLLVAMRANSEHLKKQYVARYGKAESDAIDGVDVFGETDPVEFLVRKGNDSHAAHQFAK